MTIVIAGRGAMIVLVFNAYERRWVGRRGRGRRRCHGDRRDQGRMEETTMTLTALTMKTTTKKKTAVVVVVALAIKGRLASSHVDVR